MPALAAQAPHHAEPMPVDVRLMKATARSVLLVVLVGACVAALWWAVRLPVFALRSVRIDGEVTRNNDATLRAIALPKLSGNFLTLNLREARAVFESVPWVRRAMVRRVWPMALAVQLEEHKPVALWGPEGGEERMVNTHGEVFEANVGEAEDERLLRLDGPEGSAPHMLAMATRLRTVLAPLQAGQIQALALSPRGSWRVQMDKGAALELGRGNEAEVIARTERFVNTMPRVTAQYPRPLHSADLRHAGGFAVSLRGISVTAAASSPAQALPPVAKPRR